MIYKIYIRLVWDVWVNNLFIKITAFGKEKRIIQKKFEIIGCELLIKFNFIFKKTKKLFGKIFTFGWRKIVTNLLARVISKMWLRNNDFLLRKPLAVYFGNYDSRKNIL